MKNELTKEKYLQLRQEGLSRTQIMKKYFGNPNPFYKQLDDWSIKDAEKEQAELDAMGGGAVEQKQANTAQPKPTNQLAADLDRLLQSYGLNNAVFAVVEERRRQDAKWGEQNHEPMAWMGILGEEFGELCEAVNETRFDNGPEERKKGGYQNMRKEAVQVAAVAVSFVEMLDRQWYGS